MDAIERAYFLNHVVMAKMSRILGLGHLIEREGFNEQYFAYLMAEIQALDQEIRVAGTRFYVELVVEGNNELREETLRK